MSTLQLKHPNGWFAAGREWRRALDRLSDGAFKLFVWISLQAERNSGRLTFRQAELARALGKSRRSIGTYLEELEQTGVCRRCSAPNQHSDGILEVSDAYWPYQRHSNAAAGESPEERHYLEVIRKTLLDQPCTRFVLTAADRRLARQWFQQAIPLWLVQQAILIGCGRKYVSWLNGQASAPIGSLQYFTDILQEIAQVRLSADYCAFNRLQVQRLKQRWMTQATDRIADRERACANFAQAEAAETTETR
jgi:hypothetical protein